MLTFLALSTANVASALVVMVALTAVLTTIVTITQTVCDALRIPEGTWNGWARRLMSWVISIPFLFLCRWLSQYAEWIPNIPDLCEPVWVSCIFEGIILGGMANGLWTQDWAWKICELINNIFNNKK